MWPGWPVGPGCIPQGPLWGMSCNGMVPKLWPVSTSLHVSFSPGKGAPSSGQWLLRANASQGSCLLARRGAESTSAICRPSTRRHPVPPVSQDSCDPSPRSEIQAGSPGPIPLAPGPPWTTAANPSKAVVHLCTRTPIFWSTPRILPFGSCLPSGRFSSGPEAHLTCSPFLSGELLFSSRLALLPFPFSFWRSPVLVQVRSPPLPGRGLAHVWVASVVQPLTPVSSRSLPVREPFILGRVLVRV